MLPADRTAHGKCHTLLLFARLPAEMVWDGNEVLANVLGHIKSMYPFWNRTQGRDHFLVSGVGFTELQAGRSLRPASFMQA